MQLHQSKEAQGKAAYNSFLGYADDMGATSHAVHVTWEVQATKDTPTQQFASTPTMAQFLELWHHCGEELHCDRVFLILLRDSQKNCAAWHYVITSLRDEEG